MLAVSKYPKKYLDDARSSVAAQVAAYKKKSTAHEDCESPVLSENQVRPGEIGADFAKLFDSLLR